MSFTVRRFTSDKVLATTATREDAESFVDDYVTEHGGVLMIEEEPMTAKPVYNTLQLTRCDNTERTYDVECNWRCTGWVWLARVVLDAYTIDLEITRGSLTLGETSAVRTRLAQAHGRVCTVQL